MRSVADCGPRLKRRRKAGAKSQSQDQRIQKSKKKDPLLELSLEGVVPNDGGAEEEGGGGEEVDNEDGGEDVAQNSSLDSSIGRTKAGRTQWQEKHKKGKFSPKTARDSARTPGSFAKLKHVKSDPHR